MVLACAGFKDGSQRLDITFALELRGVLPEGGCQAEDGIKPVAEVLFGEAAGADEHAVRCGDVVDQAGAGGAFVVGELGIFGFKPFDQLVGGVLGV